MPLPVALRSISWLWPAGVRAGEVGDGGVAPAAEVPARGDQLQRGAVERIEREHALRNGKQVGGVVELVVCDPEGVQSFTPVGIPLEREGERPGAGLVVALADEPLARREHIGRLDATGVGRQGVEHRRGVPWSAALRGERGKRGGGVYGGGIV